MENPSSFDRAFAGLAVIPTNDPLYGNQSAQIDTGDATFRLHQGDPSGEERAWSERAIAGTKRKREEPIHPRVSTTTGGAITPMRAAAEAHGLVLWQSRYHAKNNR